MKKRAVVNGTRKLILFIDDEPSLIARFILALEREKMPTHTLTTIAQVGEFLEQTESSPGCILVDLRFPGDISILPSLTKRGLRAGESLIPALQRHFPKTPIVIFSAEPLNVLLDIQRHHGKCHVINKDEANASMKQFVGLIRAIAEEKGPLLIEMLKHCKPGPKCAIEFERLCIDTLKFLFLPPQKQIRSQSRKGDGSNIRDAVMSNVADYGFWNQVRHEYNAKQILFEFKNLSSSIGSKEVLQLTGYLTKNTGRMGLLISRLAPSSAARKAQKRSLDEDGKLILFLDDSHLKIMCEMRHAGDDPAEVLHELKSRLELD